MIPVSNCNRNHPETPQPNLKKKLETKVNGLRVSETLRA
jgi:hypothetical protein